MILFIYKNILDCESILFRGDILDLLCDNFYLEEITRLYQNYLDKFYNDLFDKNCMLLEDEFILAESDIVCCNSSCVEFPFEDEILINMLPSPEVYLGDLIKEKVDYNFKGLSNYRIDRSYLNRILKGKLPSKNTLISIGYFLRLDIDEMSELFNVYGFAFGNYLEFLQLIQDYGSDSLNKFFMK